MSAMTPYYEIIKSITKFYKLKQKITIFEIGVRRGVSTGAVLEGIILRRNRGKLISCDTGYYYKSVKREELRKNWTFINKASQNIDWTDEIDILIIDGEHTYKAVKRDYEKYEPFVKNGGMIIMHDMNPGFSNASPYWDEIKHPKILLNLNPSGLGIITKP